MYSYADLSYSLPGPSDSSTVMLTCLTPSHRAVCLLYSDADLSYSLPVPSDLCTVMLNVLLPQLRVGGGPSGEAGDAEPRANHQGQHLQCTQRWRRHRPRGEVGSFPCV